MSIRNFYFASLASNGVIVSNNGEPGTILPENIDWSDLPEVLNFKSGQVYNISAEILSPVIISKTGSGANPIFRTSTNITGSWTDEGGGVWSMPKASKPKWIYIDGVEAKQSETPWIVITSRPDTDQLQISDANVSGYSSIVGASAVVKDRAFSLSLEYEVLAYSSGVVSLSFDIRNYNKDHDESVKFYGKVDFFDGNDEWAYEGGRLYIKSLTNPSSRSIRESVDDYGLKQSVDNVVIKDIDFQEYYQAGVYMDANNLSIYDCTFTNIRDNGVLSRTAKTNFIAKGCSFYNLGTNGIKLASCSQVSITDSEFYNIGTAGNYGWQTFKEPSQSGGFVSTGVGFGIRFHVDQSDLNQQADTSLIENNTFHDTAYCSIGLSVGINVTIRKNHIYDYMTRFSDGAGLYVYDYVGDGFPSDNILIEYNFVHDGVGNIDGLGSHRVNATAIYCDNYTYNAVVRYNTCYNIPTQAPYDFNVSSGIFCNGGTNDINIYGNTIYALGGVCMRFNGDNNVLGHTDNLVYDNNVCVGKYMYIFSAISDYTLINSATNQVFINPDASNFARYQPGDEEEYTFAEFVTAFGVNGDADVRLNTGDVFNLITNPSDDILTGTVSGYVDVDGNPVTDYTIQPWESLFLIAQ